LPLRFITPEELMKAHGLDGYKFDGLSFGEQMGLVGRGMSVVSLTIVIGAALKAIGYGQHVDPQKK
jgi:hypothetical protein